MVPTHLTPMPTHPNPVVTDLDTETFGDVMLFDDSSLPVRANGTLKISYGRLLTNRKYPIVLCMGNIRWLMQGIGKLSVTIGNSDEWSYSEASRDGDATWRHFMSSIMGDVDLEQANTTQITKVCYYSFHLPAKWNNEFVLSILKREIALTCRRECPGI